MNMNMNMNMGHQDLGLGGLEDDFPTEVPRMIGDEVNMFVEGFNEYFLRSQRLSESATGLIHFLQHTRVSYNNAVKERDLLLEQLAEKTEKLRKCETTLQRYECANDPVVASDGYTYERGELEGYIKECKSSQSPAISHQTKEELTDRMVSNHSLISLTKELGDVLKPDFNNVLPDYRPRTNVEAYTVGNSLSGKNNNNNNNNNHLHHGGQGGAWGGEDHQGGGKVIGASGTTGQGHHGSIGGGGTHLHGHHSHLGSRSSRTGTGNTVENGGEGRGSGGHRRFDGPHGGKHGVTGSNNHMGSQAHQTSTTGTAGSGGGAGSEGPKPELHPCLRIYRCCNFKGDCTFANYPYEACLNHIKGKCRFGAQCKELHVDRDDPRFLNPRSNNVQQQQQQQQAKSDASKQSGTEASSNSSPTDAKESGAGDG